MTRLLPFPLLALLLTAVAWNASPRATRVYVNGLPLGNSGAIRGQTTDRQANPWTAEAGVFIWGGPQSPHLPGLPPDRTSAPPPFPPNPRPVAPQPGPGRP